MADEPVQIFLSDARRIDRVVRRVEGDRESLVGEGGPGGIRPSRGRERVKITGATRDGSNWRWTYTGRPQIRSSGTFGDWADAPRFDADVELQNTFEDSGTTASISPIATGIVVDAWYERYTSGSVDSVRWCFCVANQAPSGAFPVQVEKTGGSNGTATTPASYTYTVRDLQGNTLGTAVPVTRPRPNGEMTYQAGSSGYGLAFYASDGSTLILWDAGEIESTEPACGGS